MWHSGKDTSHVGSTNKPDDHGQEHVVQKDRPSDQEACLGPDRFAHVGVGGSADGESGSESTVACGGKQHGYEGQQIRASRSTLTFRSDDAEDSQADERCHIGQAE